MASDEHQDREQEAAEESDRTDALPLTMQKALENRRHVIMVRINDEAQAHINDLREAGLVRSRSEAAAYLIAEGIAARRSLFERIRDKIQQIQQIREDLRSLTSPDRESGESK